MTTELPPIDPRSPRAKEARANAHALIAASLGGPETYKSLWESLFGGPRPVSAESIVGLLYHIEALVTISTVVIEVATDEDEEVQRTMTRLAGDPQQLLAWVDKATEQSLAERLDESEES